nr:hypothetical protein [Marinagarivorans algicola]
MIISSPPQLRLAAANLPLTARNCRPANANPRAQPVRLMAPEVQDAVMSGSIKRESSILKKGSNIASNSASGTPGAAILTTSA